METQDQVETTASGKTIPKVESKNELINILKTDFASGAIPVYINSLKREVMFKEVSVDQQKKVSRMLIGNEHRKDIEYDAHCAIINQACAADNFDVYNLTEFDRLKLLIVLYQANVFQNDVSFVCRECGAENKYQLSFDNVIHKLDQVDLIPQHFTYEHRGMTYDFTTEYPNVRLLSKFHKQYYAKHSIKTKRDVNVNNQLISMEYIDLFISKLTVTQTGTAKSKTIDFALYNPEDIEDIIKVLPQDVLLSDNEILRFIAKNYIEVINYAFDKHTCKFCGAVQEKEGENQAEAFF